MILSSLISIYVRRLRLEIIHTGAELTLSTSITSPDKDGRHSMSETSRESFPYRLYKIMSHTNMNRKRLKRGKTIKIMCKKSWENVKTLCVFFTLLSTGRGILHPSTWC